MKNKKIIIIVFLSILYFGFLLQKDNTLHSEKKNKKDRNNILTLPAISNTNRFEWNETWDGSIDDRAHGIAVDGVGNAFITGSAGYGLDGSDVTLLKYNSEGNLLWNIKWGVYDWNKGNGIAIDGSGNLFITGYSQGDVILLKYNQFGNLFWYKKWGGSSGDIGYGIAIDGAGNIFITGYTSSYGAGGPDILLLKYNSSGDLEWYTTWGGIWEGKGSGIAIDTLGNVFITGYTDSYGAGDDVLVLKYDSDGNLLWYKTWGGSEDDTGEGIVVDSSGSVFIIGTTYSYGVGSHDVFLLKYDSSGNLLWDKTWGGSDSDFGNGIAVDNSGNAFITGHTYSYGTGRGDIFLSKYDSDGNLLWYKTWEGFFYNNGQGIAVDSIGNAYITGYFTSRENLSNHDIFIIKYGVDTDNDGLSDNDEIFIYFTNPNNPDTDFDGLSDGKEIELGTNPLDADTDNDRFTDREEVNSGTDPLNFFDNWLSRGILITFSIAIIMIGYKRYKEKHGKKVNVISEKGEAFKKPNNLKESIKSYQETVLKMKKTNKSIPKSTQNVFMELQIKDLIEKADNLKREGEIIKALETINYAGYIVDKITESSLKQLLTKNIINNLDQIYIEMVEKKIEEALNLREMKDFDESINMFNNALSDADKIRDTTLMDKNFSILKDYINTTRMIKTKDFIFNLSQNSERLEVSEIVEKCGMGEGFILSAILDMIKNREISAEYIKSTKEVVFNRQVDVEQIDRLMKSFEDWEKEGEGKKL